MLLIGENVTAIVQEEPVCPVGAKLFGQLFVWLKPPGAEMLVIVTGVVPLLVKVTFWAVLEVPTA